VGEIRVVPDALAAGEAVTDSAPNSLEALAALRQEGQGIEQPQREVAEAKEGPAGKAQAVAAQQPKVVAELIEFAVGPVVGDALLVVAVKDKQPGGQRVHVAQGVFEAGLGPLTDGVAAGSGLEAVVVVDAVDEEGLVEAAQGPPGGQVHEASALNQKPHRARMLSAAPLVEVVGAEHRGFWRQKAQCLNELRETVSQKLRVLVHGEQPVVALVKGAPGGLI